MDFNGEFYPHNKSELRCNATIFQLRKFLLRWIENFSERGRRFFHIYEMNITIVSSKRYMTREFYVKHPMQTIELKMTMIIDDNPYLISILDRNINHIFIENIEIFNLIKPNIILKRFCFIMTIKLLTFDCNNRLILFFCLSII